MSNRVRPGPASPAEVLAPLPLAERTLGRLVEGRANTAGDHEVVEVAGERLTWSEMERRSAALAGSLHALGVRRGDVVCQVGGNTAGHVVAVFALARLGAVECPLNTGLRGRPLRHVLGHSGAEVILADAEHLERLEPEVDGTALKLAVVRGEGGARLGRLRTLPASDLPDGTVPPADVAPRDPATIIYTSGTTGAAKGVVHAHHFAFSAAAVKIGTWGLGPDDVLFSTLPLFHANARYSTLLTACVLDARAVLVGRFSASAFWSQVTAAGATEVASVGTVAAILLECPPGQWDRAHRVRMMHGAGALAGPRRVEFEERFGVRLVNGFSMSETSHVSTTPPEDPGRHRGAGRPVPGFSVAIVDGDDQPVPPGAVGEIIVRPGLPWSMFLGYHRDPQATVDSFSNLWFHTGDLGRIDEDGYLHWVDRTKDAIRRRGEMISSRDVEEAATAHPDVAEASAIGVPGDLGEEEVLLVVRPVEGHEVDLPALLAHCRRRLPDFAVPRYFRVVRELPLGATHKVDKGALRQAWPAAPDSWDAAVTQPARSNASR